MPVELQRTFCRICEAHCGLVAEVERANQRVLRLIPDREHPVSRGYCCAKGLRLGEVHHDPDRLDFPRKRGQGGFERISWEQALSEIGAAPRRRTRSASTGSFAPVRTPICCSACCMCW